MVVHHPNIRLFNEPQKRKNINRKTKHCQPLMNALVERFEAKNNTFNVGQTQIYFGLEDVLIIIGLPNTD